MHEATPFHQVLLYHPTKRSVELSGLRGISTVCAGLPVWQAREDFVAMINGHQTTILVGETGSGKTTQIAQFIAEAGYCSSRKLIACTQVRPCPRPG